MTESFTNQYTKENNVFKCQWHSFRFPEPDDIVVGYIKSVEDDGVRVEIMDYMFIEGFMPIHELSKKRVQSVRSLFKEGQIKPLLVMSVDKQTGFVDLSNKHVSMYKDDIASLDKYGQLVKIMQRWVTKTGCEIPWNEIMEKTLWKFENKEEAYQTFLEIKMGTNDIYNVFEIDNLDLLNEIIDDYITYEAKLKIEVNLQTWTINPMNVLQNVLKDILERFPGAKIEKVNPPDYVISLKSSKKKLIHELLEVPLDDILEKYDDIKCEVLKKIEEKII